MTNGPPVVWPAEPHTKAKHRILSAYLDAWAPILSRQGARVGARNRPIRFIDAFAGPGEYEHGEDGSPILAIRSVLEHHPPLPLPIHFLFIEKDESRYQHLRSVLDRFAERIMRNPICEVLTYLDYKNLNRFLSDPSKDATRTAAFGDDSWKQAREETSDRRHQAILQLYKRKLMELGGSRFVWDFAMSDQDGRLLYWLFFCTNSLRGLEEMKKAMWKVDSTGMFRYADDEDTAQMKMFRSFDDEWLANRLLSHFGGQRVRIEDVRLFVLTKTNPFNYAKCMQTMLRKHQIKLPEGGKRVSFLDDVKKEVVFVERMLI